MRQHKSRLYTKVKGSGIKVLKKIPWYGEFSHCDLWFETKYALVFLITLVLSISFTFLKAAVPFCGYLQLPCLIISGWIVFRQFVIFLGYVGQMPIYKYTKTYERLKNKK